MYALQACTALNVDIITMDACSRLPFKLKPGIVKPALARGIMFEVLISNEDVAHHQLPSPLCCDEF
jgi:hypothetical protein